MKTRAKIFTDTFVINNKKLIRINNFSSGYNFSVIS